jgi:hypothetical protein
MKWLLLTGVFFLGLTKSSGQDLLDSVKSNSKVITELKDTYRAFYVNDIITDQKEMINVVLNDNSDEEMKSLLNGYIKECEALKKYNFSDKALGAYIAEYIKLTVQSYKVAKDKGFKSPEFRKDYESYKSKKGKYMDYLYTTYSTGHFIKLTEQEYYKINDKNNYIKSPDYANYKILKVKNLKAALKLLDSIADHTSNFQESVIYKIEIADQYVVHSDTLKDNGGEIAIEKYKAILDQNRYCIYLFESWLKWRTVTQQNNGLSKTSEIPNDEYNKMREQVALVILKYTVGNEKDEMAINEFLLMATHDNIMRFGDYQFGNQNTVEYHEIFDEMK